MGLNNANNQDWPKIFRDLILSNCRYWLNYAQHDTKKLLYETPQVLQALSYALPLSEAWESARDLILCLNTLMIRHGWGVGWKSFLIKGVARSLEEKDPAEIELRLQLGNLYRLQGYLVEAHDCFQQALNLCNQYELRTHYWTLMNHLGHVARLSMQYEEARIYCQQVLTQQKLPNVDQAEALNIMGLVAYDRREWEEALDYLDQALNLYHSLADSYHMARVLNNRGLVLLRSGYRDEAKESYQKAIEQFQASGDRTEIFKAVMNLGNVFLMKKEYEMAIQQYQKALPAFKQCSYLVELMYVYNNLGMAHTNLADWEQAESYFLASLEIAYDVKDIYNRANILDNFGQMLLKAKRPTQAHEILTQALEILSTAPGNPANVRLQRVIEERIAHSQKVDSLSKKPQRN